MRILSRLLAFVIVGFLIYACAAGGGDSLGGGGSNNPGGGGGGGNTGNPCQQGTSLCGSQCVDLKTNRLFCGSCTTQCGGQQTCSSGQCTCVSPLSACGTSCLNLASDGNNCGACGAACTGGQVCSQGHCSNTCQASETKCGINCVNANTDPLNCGQCDVVCSGGQGCVNGNCACPSPQQRCGGACVDVTSNAQNCGTCGHACASGQTCAGGVCGGSTGAGGSSGGGGAQGTGGAVGSGGAAGNRDAGGTGGSPEAGIAMRNGCPLTPGLIADFEEGMGKPFGIVQEGRNPNWGTFNDGAAGATETMTVDTSGGTANCDKWALHVMGRGYASFSGFGVDIDDMTPLSNPPTPIIYNATQHTYTGIRFKAKIGTGHDSKAAVRFNISTPATESNANPGGNCNPTGALPCFQHPGKFLSVIPADNMLSTTWKTFSFCFDRDLYPQSLPSNMTNDQRNTVGSAILKLQFSFNVGKDYTVPVPTNGTAYMPPVTAANTPFDFWIDQVEFFTGACPNTATFTSAAGTAKPFPENTGTGTLGTCATAANAALFGSAISQAYATWTSHFVRGNAIVAPEQNNITTSEAMGYGMMIAAAMGDKTTFDAFSGYVQSKLDGNGLMNWNSNPGANSATDADGDIIYAYLMAAKQWGTASYTTMANSMIAGFKAHLVRSSDGVLASGDVALGGTNPSYFAPYAYRLFGAFSPDPIAAGYRLVNANVGAATAGIPTDWSDFVGGPIAAPNGAQVTNQIAPGQAVFGYDAARVPWRLGMDKCLNAGADTTAITAIVNFFAQKYANGAQIDQLKAGWIKAGGTAPTTAAPMQGSFIGPMGVAGMALGGTVGTVMRDRSFRTMLDILENGDFNHTYFPSTVGLITALVMSGNFPTP